MSKNLTRKGLALGTALAFVVTGFTGIAPASAAAGDVVSIAENSGTGFAAYDTDFLAVKVKVDSDVVTAASYEKLALNISNPDSLDVLVKAADGVDSSSKLNYYLFDDLGNKSPVQQVTAASSVFTLDFSAISNGTANQDWTSAVVDLKDVAVASSIKYDFKVAADADESSKITVTAFVDDEDNTFESTDKYQSKATAITFYDPTLVTVTPRIERFVGATNTFLNGKSGKLGGSLSFSPALNVDQVDLTSFTFAGTTDGTANVVDGFTAEYLDGATAHAGRIYGEVKKTSSTAASLSLAKGAAYKFSATKASKTFTSASYTPAGQQTTSTDITAITDSTVGSLADTAQTGNNVKARAGVKSLTYTVAADEEKAGVVAYAVVTATDLVANSTLTVGSKTISEGESVLVAGATNAKGEFAVTVVSSTAKAAEKYDIAFSVLKVDGSFATDSVATTYETGAAANTLTVDSAILAGSSVSAKVTVEDQFGKAASTNSAGKALYVHFTASNTDNLDKYVAVSNGAAVVTFSNYVAKGASDALVATLGIGGANSTDFATTGYGDTADFSLYNPEAADAVSTDATLADKKITYDAFITGTASATNVAPTDGEGHALAGTVVDASGVGIPGAVVTVAAAGLQFVKLDDSGAATGSYYKDTITVAADADGSYSVKLWAHKVSSTGITVTTTSGGKKATTKLTTTGRSNIAADDLVFTWDAPKHPAVDTTYITTVKLADKWGNPLSGANLTVEAAGALLINGGDTVTKTTSAAGVVRVYFRSIAKTDGIANLTATLNSVTVDGTTLTAPTGDTFENVISSDVVVGADAIAVAGKTAGTAKVTAYNAKGKTVAVYVAGKLVATKKATSGSYSFTVKAKSGAVVKVKVGSSIFFNASVN